MGTQTMLSQKRNQQCKPISTFGLLPLSGLQRIWERHERKWNEKKNARNKRTKSKKRYQRNTSDLSHRGAYQKTKEQQKVNHITWK